MDFYKKILVECDSEADKKLAISCLIMDIFMVVMAILEATHVFKISPVPLYTALAISILCLTLPFVLYYGFKVERQWVRYLILFLQVVHIGILYSVISYHVIILLAFLLIMSCLYNKRKYVTFTAILTVIMIVISHVVAYYLDIVPDEPLTTMKGTWLYGIVPRVIEFLALYVICYFITRRIETLIKTLAEKNQELYDDQYSIVSALAEIIEAQSENTGSHVKRVSLYTAVLCKGLGYSEEETWKVSLAAMLHDVGKISIPKEILEKPAKLTPEEFEVIKTHVEYGKKLLENAPGEIMKISEVIAYEHHEKWDGTGYLHMKGEEIDKYARCVALADVYDALMSKRPYKEPFQEEEAYRTIISESGIHFDPKVVEAFIKHHDEFIKITEENKEV